ncbi:MAG: zinc metallopeptidase [Eubacteriales bacterium]
MYLPFFFEPTMFILIPGLILAAYAQSKVSSAYNKYLRVANTRGITGADTAREILNKNDLYDIKIELAKGKLSDHYDPRKKILRLSHDVYHGKSVAALAIAAHEVGHAIQHHKQYTPLVLRNSIAPVVSLASNAAWFLFFIGFLFQGTGFMNLGIIFFTSAVIFHIVTLPVEFNASHRAIEQLNATGLIQLNEGTGVKKVLDAAALTYVAATIVAFLQLMRMIILRGSRD